uniref:Uncharacterized protein n=1 Tax=Anguilla anguilla TaxID=7936 RepID=A0A0E9X2A9_ANGAN
MKQLMDTQTSIFLVDCLNCAFKKCVCTNTAFSLPSPHAPLQLQYVFIPQKGSCDFIYYLSLNFCV